VHVILIEKSNSDGMKLDIYGKDLFLLETETFPDLYTLNFHLQTLAKKHKIAEGLIVVHDPKNSKVSLALAKDERSFFVD